MFSLLRREIERHKWFLSERRGTDVGWHAAEQDWLERHFAAWKQHHWNQAIIELLRAELPVGSKEPAPRKLKQWEHDRVVMQAAKSLWSRN